MNILQKLKKQLENFHINDDFLSFYKKANTFKIKFFSPIASLSVLSWLFFSVFVLHIPLHTFSDYFLGLFVGVFIQTIFIILFLSYITPMNGTFFKFVLRLMPNSILKSFIDSYDYQEEILENLFKNSQFKENLLHFYRFMDKVNFADSYDRNFINYKNKEIKNHLDKIIYIIQNDDKKAFSDFFKKKFFPDFKTYSHNEKVLELLELITNDKSDSSGSEENLSDDLLMSFREELTNKNKLKNFL